MKEKHVLHPSLGSPKRRPQVMRAVKIGGLIGAVISAVQLFVGGQVVEAIGVATAALSSAGALVNGQ